MPKERSEQPVYSRQVGFDMAIAFDASDRQEYVGYAPTGSATSASVWQIYKLSYHANGQVEKLRYASSTDDFIHSFDNRASYDYTDI